MRSDWALSVPPSRNGGSEEKPQRSPRKKGPEARRQTSIWSQRKTVFQGLESDQPCWILPQLRSLGTGTEWNNVEVIGPWQQQQWYPEWIWKEEMERRWVGGFILDCLWRKSSSLIMTTLQTGTIIPIWLLRKRGPEELSEHLKPMGPKLPLWRVWLQLLGYHSIKLLVT